MVYNRELDNTYLSGKIEGQKQMPLYNFSASNLGIKIHKLKNELRVRTEEQHSRHAFLPVTTRSHDNWNKKILKITPPSSSLPIGDLYYCKKWYRRIRHILSRKPGNIFSRSGVAFVFAITSLMQQRPFRKPWFQSLVAWFLVGIYAAVELQA